jgi:hypothetical protein
MAETKEKKRGVGTAATEAIMGGATNDETLAAVHKEFPEANTSIASINWYRNKMRADGKKVKTSRELTKARKAAEAKTAKESADPLE